MNGAGYGHYHYTMKKLITALLTSLIILANMANAKEESFSAPLKEGDGSAKTVLAVYIDVEPEKREEFLKEMLALVAATQKEDGNLEYTLWRDYKGDNTFFLYEEYKDKDAFAKHEASDHFQHFVKRLGEIGGITLRGKVMNVESATHPNHKK